MADRFTFTKEKLDALKAPLGGRRAVHDAKTPGLILRVTPTGAKTFSLFRRVKGGEPFRETLGRYGKGGISIDQARRLAATSGPSSSPPSSLLSGHSPTDIPPAAGLGMSFRRNTDSARIHNFGNQVLLLRVLLKLA